MNALVARTLACRLAPQIFIDLPRRRHALSKSGHAVTECHRIVPDPALGRRHALADRVLYVVQLPQAIGQQTIDLIKFPESAGSYLHVDGTGMGAGTARRDPRAVLDG